VIAAMGFVNLVFQAIANASVQLAVEPRLRGRVMGLYLLVFIGGTPIGAPIIGAVTSHFGARAGMALCGAIPALAAVITAVAMAHRRRSGPLMKLRPGVQPESGREPAGPRGRGRRRTGAGQGALAAAACPSRPLRRRTA
jgi:MFS family permease